MNKVCASVSILLLSVVHASIIYQVTAETEVLPLLILLGFFALSPHHLYPGGCNIWRHRRLRRCLFRTEIIWQ